MAEKLHLAFEDSLAVLDEKLSEEQRRTAMSR